ncbi:methionine--tRNA ligase [Plebeiibacterium marinum]|uniref:Methionine--tRNA ligase n=1 Tax=Plebeiibacterium marinum TaxID=2992111 RepID=A0AAE3MEG3_9BACT|nr:methionine--tRNA ligase [Plebeiobacterium marinum]MCW3806106.1 methionine--tRNA ligase [Plebeiobacterium marinum]
MDNFKRTLVTTALPYANGPVHIGHLAGVYVPADIYVRYLRMKGEDVLLIGGSDEHGVPITLKAKNEGVTPQDIVDRYHGIIKKSFEDFGITFDVYSRTTTETHYKTASDFFKTLYDKGEFVEKESDQYYDEDAKQFLADRYITGTCPHCGNEGAYGDQCESCGTSLNATDLKNPISVISGSVPVVRKTKHWYLPLDKHEPFLKKWILEDHKEWKANVYGQCKSWIDQGLQPRAVSRDLDWGVPVPVEGADGKVLYVWFDAPIGYISATKELTPEWEKYWKDKETRMLHFIGKDNIVFHCIVFPSMLKAEGSFNLPENVPANEFLNLEGDKISTSRNWAVWLHEYLEEFKDQQDVLRYVLAANAPETKDNDFTWKDFQARNNNELVAILGNFVNRAIVLTHKYYGGKTPEMGSVVEDFDKQTLADISEIVKKVQSSLDSFRFREAIKEMMNLARLGNKYLADTEPWKLVKTDEERVKTIMNVSLQITANLSVLMEPFLPFSAVKLQNMLNISGIVWKDLGKTDMLVPGHEINKPELLFAKIEDDTIQKQLDKLEASKLANEAAAKEVAPAKENISFDEFTKMDIRIGTILEAEKVAKTKKLLKLVVDTGIDKRTVVSGIAEFFAPEDIVGKQVSILVNLAPRKIKGIESQGMILMGEDANGELVFLQPSKAIKPGSEVR